MRTTIKLSGGAAPTEFRLFHSGWNATEHGKFLFDAKAAKSVMAAYKAWGVDLAIDLEHGMLDVQAGAPDPTARDARGWFKLELRPDGSLWAVSVSWTPDGAQRLEQKRQRYVSPAFEVDPKSKRVIKVINAAITALPATHDAPALVAATRSDRLSAGGKMDSAWVKDAIDCIASHDENQALDLLKQIIATVAAGGASTGDAANSVAADDPSDDDGDDAGSEGDGADGVAPPPKTKKNATANSLTVQQLRICQEKGISPAEFLTAQRAMNRPSFKRDAPAKDWDRKVDAALLAEEGERLEALRKQGSGGGFKPTR